MNALLQPIVDVILTVLRALYGFVGDYGVAIVLLTVIIRIVLTPLTLKQTKSMYELQRIQPKLKELQKKYKDNKEKLQEETLKFYQENKVNPFGGCLPLLLQMPILFALFRALNTQKDLGNFLFFIPDLSTAPKVAWGDGLLVALPYLVLVALFGLSAWLPQHLMSKDKQSRMMGAYMGVFMIWIGWISPAGVLLYWVVSSIWQIAQQQAVIGFYRSKEGA